MVLEFPLLLSLWQPLLTSHQGPLLCFPNLCFWLCPFQVCWPWGVSPSIPSPPATSTQQVPTPGRCTMLLEGPAPLCWVPLGEPLPHHNSASRKPPTSPQLHALNLVPLSPAYSWGPTALAECPSSTASVWVPTGAAPESPISPGLMQEKEPRPSPLPPALLLLTRCARRASQCRACSTALQEALQTVPTNTGSSSPAAPGGGCVPSTWNPAPPTQSQARHRGWVARLTEGRGVTRHEV